MVIKMENNIEKVNVNITKIAFRFGNAEAPFKITSELNLDDDEVVNVKIGNRYRLQLKSKKVYMLSQVLLNSKRNINVTCTNEDVYELTTEVKDKSKPFPFQDGNGGGLYGQNSILGGYIDKDNNICNDPNIINIEAIGTPEGQPKKYTTKIVMEDYPGIESIQESFSLNVKEE